MASIKTVFASVDYRKPMIDLRIDVDTISRDAVERQIAEEQRRCGKLTYELGIIVDRWASS